MTENNKGLALLPNGFVDLLPPEAGREHGAVAALLKKFSAFGYQLVKPPLAEFEDSLFAPGPGAPLAEESFRLMDPVSHKMMGLRSDITTQIARIASSRLAKQARPLRLMYAGDVLRIKGSGQRTARQFMQAGCEIIGREEDEADIEICVIALAGLKALGVTNITLDLTLPRLVERILAEQEASPEAREQARAALSRRDQDRIARLEKPLSDILGALLKAAGAADKALQDMRGLNFSGAVKKDFDKLSTVYQGVLKASKELGFKDINITIDPVETAGFEYEEGVAFSLFADGVRGELGRGGRYNIVFGGGEAGESATGFTLYMDTVMNAMRRNEQSDTVFVAADAPWSAMKKLQAEGWVTVRGTGRNEARARCTHEYKNGKIKEIR